MSLDNPSRQFSVILRWYDAVTTWKFDVLEEQFSEDYKHTTLPATANDPPKNKAEGIEYAKGVAALLGHRPLKYEIFRTSENAGSIWVHSKLFGEGPGGVPFNNESIFIFTLSSSSRDDHIKITAIQEFIDTKLAADFAAAAAVASASASAAPAADSTRAQQ